MNDKELRLKVLSRIYRSYNEGKPVPGTIAEVGIEGITVSDYMRVSYYLIEHNLVYGEITETNAGSISWAGRITGPGIDLIERFIDKSIEQVEKKKISFVSKLSPYLEKLTELFGIWSTHLELFQQAAELLTKLIGG